MLQTLLLDDNATIHIIKFSTSCNRSVLCINLNHECPSHECQVTYIMEKHCLFDKDLQKETTNVECIICKILIPILYNVIYVLNVIYCTNSKCNLST